MVRGLDMAREVGKVDTVDGAIGGEDIPFTIDLDARVGVTGDETELLVVVARVVYEGGDVVVREAGVFAGGAEEAAAHRLGKLWIAGELDGKLLG